ncbi:MAG: hypothetical protein M1835_005522 [Candelina submexicana]|nr:MAG: hypothetical protein M1835_005522 [Candelina submexicana]
MSVAAMVKQRPPSPPPSNGGELQYGLHHLVEHNANTQYEPNQYDFNEGSQYNSGQYSSYNSPASMYADQRPADLVNGYMEQQYGGSNYLEGYHDPDDLGLRIQFNGYPGPNTTYYPEQPGNGYSALPADQQNYLQRDFQPNSPPTPSSNSEQDTLRRTTRSGRSIATTESPQVLKALPQSKTRIAKPTRIKKAPRQGKGDKPRVPKLSAPLSELTKGYDHIPIRNMEEWVNRPVEVRKQEVEKRNGYVTRPMNSFMLYRSAFAERTKLWCLQNNHQVVSSVSGESWPLEPEEVREQYNEYAKIERNNHQNAHPGYKFSPSKAQSTGRKRKVYSDDEDEEPSELDDPDLDWGTPRQQKAKGRPNKRKGKEAGYPANSSLHDNFRNRALESREGSLNRSSYHATNPGKPLPAAMGASDLYGHYYQTTVHPSTSVPNVEDVRIRKTETPGMQYGGTPPLIGLPGGQHYELLQQHSYHSSPAPMEEGQLDPFLLAYDNNNIGQSGGHLSIGGDMSFNNMVIDQQLGGAEYEQGSIHEYAGGGSQTSDYQHFPAYSAGLQALPEGSDPWHLDGDIGPLDAGSEFDKWMEEHSGG